MSLADDKISHIDRQIEFLNKEQGNLQTRTERWAATKREQLMGVMETLQEYRREIVKGTMLK